MLAKTCLRWNPQTHTETLSVAPRRKNCLLTFPRKNSSPLNPNKNKILYQDLEANISAFQESKIQDAINKLKANKAPGPDGAITELFKHLDADNIKTLTSCLNILWQTKQAPDDFTNAFIASLYKKGDHENPENYRPISLLNTTYKIFAFVLKIRLAPELEKHLHQTQFGFRKGRSTVDPLFCLRRITDVVEQGSDQLVLIFLDWEKAFDKINHQKMFQSHRRLNIPEDLLAAISSLKRHLGSKLHTVKKIVGGCLKELESGKAVPSVPTFSF